MPCSRIILNSDQLSQIINRLAEQVSPIYCSIDNCLALVAMDGAKHFADDLLAKLPFSIETEYIKATSYIDTISSGTVLIDGHQELQSKIKGKNILLIDDIYDTGRTLSALIQWLNACNPADIKTCVLLEKEICHEKEVKIDFLGTTIEDAFLVGYGLDYNGQYRNLPYIGILNEEIINGNQSNQYESTSD